ncbi:MAG: class I SAM-dependent methyltransferase [Actinobacteria bacterium]|nr:MAG: class I SAM-dependent methyltransferase [Actinomycetota bacterium]
MSSIPNTISPGGRASGAERVSSGPTVEDLEHSRYFLTAWLPPLLRATAERFPPRVLADLGAGDGGTLWPLDHAGLVGDTIYAVDISAEHVALCERLSPKVRGIISDVAHVDELPDASVDAVVSSQVIEHLPDDAVLAPEIARLLRPGGWFYVSSVIRGPRGFWFYRGKPPAPERWQLDPTHMREYESEEHFRSAVSHPELELDVVRSSQLKFGLTDFILRMAALARIVKRERLPVLYLQLPTWVASARRSIGVPIPGYRWVEATGRKRLA